ncbi:MAG: hypothetical protein A2Y65_05250 [Deltaproteobacteria bacterium RBG_13_52_11]|nr:MAG: hypothetical protein A2Y65_05250 [Deltaproteobacteria bacterium RBG_13_52_11]
MKHSHLCQPDLLKSCGACCGLYNYRANGRRISAERLRRRSEIFISLRSEPNRYCQEVAVLEGAKLYETIYNCEFLGFIDERAQRVGCLLHPQLNNGVDLRGISFYGDELCRHHLCPSYEKLTAAEKEVVVCIVNDWYLYGLCITDIDLIKSYLAHIQNAVGEEFNPEKLHKKPELLRVMGEFFSWKEAWPFRQQEALRFGKYYFLEGEHHLARIDYGKIGIDPSPYDGIFLSFASEFKEGKEISTAEEMVKGNIEQAVALYLTG